MTPDGSPIVGEVPSIKGFVNAVGMCGQGFMLGPGLGTVITHIVLGTLSPKDQKILNGFSLERDFNRVEMLK